MNDSSINTATAAAEEAPSTIERRQLRTITLVEQRDRSGRVKWVMLEGNTTAFGMSEAELLHAVSRQVFGVQLHQVASTIHEHSQNAFVSGVNCGQQQERYAAQERARAARAAAVPTGECEPAPADEILRTRGRDRKTKAPTITKRATKVAARKKPAKKAPAKRRRN